MEVKQSEQRKVIRLLQVLNQTEYDVMYEVILSSIYMWLWSLLLLPFFFQNAMQDLEDQKCFETIFIFSPQGV